MIKVLFLPLNYGDVIQEGVYDAFRQAGCTLKVFDYFGLQKSMKTVRRVRDELISQVKLFKPHLMHMQIQHTNVIDHVTVDKIRRENPNLIITNWTGDVRNAVPHPFNRMSIVSTHNLISSTGQLEMFRNHTRRDVQYWQIGFNPKLYYPPEKPRDKFDWDCIFIGNHGVRERYPGASQRERVCNLLRQNFGDRFALYGGNWPKSLKSKGSLPQSHVVNYYHRSMCSISINHYNDLNHYFSDRLLMCMASGRPTVCYRFPGWESYFTDGCDLLIANTLDEIPQKVLYLRNNPDHANYIGMQGAAKVLAEHTYFSRVNELLEMVGLK